MNPWKLDSAKITAEYENLLNDTKYRSLTDDLGYNVHAFGLQMFIAGKISQMPVAHITRVHTHTGYAWSSIGFSDGRKFDTLEDAENYALDHGFRLVAGHITQSRDKDHNSWYVLTCHYPALAINIRLAEATWQDAYRAARARGIWIRPTN